MQIVTLVPGQAAVSVSVSPNNSLCTPRFPLQLYNGIISLMPIPPISSFLPLTSRPHGNECPMQAS